MNIVDQLKHERKRLKKSKHKNAKDHRKVTPLEIFTNSPLSDPPGEV